MEIPKPPKNENTLVNADEKRPMNQLEKNVMHSFKRAKTDIIQMHQGFLHLSANQKETLELFNYLKEQEMMLYQRIQELDDLREKELSLYKQMKGLDNLKHLKTLLSKKTAQIETLKAQQSAMDKRLRLLEGKKTVKKTVAPRTRKVYLAAKNAKKFHEKNCPFAQNIKPKNAVKFKSKAKPLNLGLKKCNCVK